MRRAEPPRVASLCFSPGGGTRRVLEAMTRVVELPVARIELTTPEQRGAAPRALYELPETSHVIVGAPVYSGQLPSPVVEAVASLDGRGLPTAAVVVFGNRDVGRALQQLVGLLADASFRVTAAAAFIAEHSLSSLLPVAQGRPDRSDERRAARFAESFLDGAEGALPLDPLGPELQGRRSLVDRLFPPTGPSPESVDEARCNGCGLCVRRCTMNVLDGETRRYRDMAAKARCIGCQGCVRSCPTAARRCQPPAPVRWLIRRVLRDASVRRREPWSVVASPQAVG